MYDMMMMYCTYAVGINYKHHALACDTCDLVTTIHCIDSQCAIFNFKRLQIYYGGDDDDDDAYVDGAYCLYRTKPTVVLSRAHVAPLIGFVSTVGWRTLVLTHVSTLWRRNAADANPCFTTGLNQRTLCAYKYLQRDWQGKRKKRKNNNAQTTYDDIPTIVIRYYTGRSGGFGRGGGS